MDSSWAVSQVTLKPIIVAYDGMAVVVNANNPLAKLTLRQVEQIFAGDITDWSQVGGSPGKISIYTRNTSSGTYADFKELAMKKRDYASSSQKMAGNEQIAAEVELPTEPTRIKGSTRIEAKRQRRHPRPGGAP